MHRAALLCRLLKGAIANQLLRGLQPPGDGSAANPSDATTSAAAADLAASVDGLTSATLRYHITAAPAIQLLTRLLAVLAAAAGAYTFASEVSCITFCEMPCCQTGHLHLLWILGFAHINCRQSC